MRLTLADLCAARWSEEILDEWARNLAEKHKNVSPASIARCRELMNQHAQDALVAGYEPIVPSLELPDADDRHVLATAIHCKARAIVTFNLKDFPEAALATHGIEAIHPDDFLLRLLQSDLAGVCDVVRVSRRVEEPCKCRGLPQSVGQRGLGQTAASASRFGPAVAAAVSARPVL